MHESISTFRISYMLEVVKNAHNVFARILGRGGHRRELQTVSYYGILSLH